MDILEFLGSLLTLITDGIGNLIAFIKFVPELFYTCFDILPVPFKTLVLVFAPLFTLAIYYKFVRGY